MTEKQLKEIIKSKEAELKALKDQLKEMQVKEENTIELNNIEYTVEGLNKYTVTELTKIAKKNNIRIVSKKKETLVNNIISVLDGRNNKGWAFRN